MVQKTEFWITVLLLDCSSFPLCRNYHSRTNGGKYNWKTITINYNSKNIAYNAVWMKWLRFLVISRTCSYSSTFCCV